MICIGIIDCGISNVASVQNALTFLGHRSTVLRDPAGIEECSHLLLPGDGSFPIAMRQLAAVGLDAAVRRAAYGGKPLLGVCLGMQLLADEGEEFERTAGLGLIRGRVRRISPGDPRLPVPQVGWNDVVFCRKSRLAGGNGGRQAYYFMQGFAVADADAAVVTASCDYGGPITAVIEQGNVFGVQFHPEKSQRAGLAILDAFARVRTAAPIGLAQ
jgi:glutamine amidotransferase